MFNLVELVAEEQTRAPCKWGNIVPGHACYCHNDAWKEGPRKCPIYRSHGIDDLTKWRKARWGTHVLPMFKGVDKIGRPIVRRERVPAVNDNGCPKFEVNPHYSAGEKQDG